MAQVTAPVVLDSTAQSMNTNLASIVTAITNSGGGPTISAGTTELQDGVTSLPTGEVYLVYSE